jgi:hypothetical protein
VLGLGEGKALHGGLLCTVMEVWDKKLGIFESK